MPNTKDKAERRLEEFTTPQPLNKGEVAVIRVTDRLLRIMEMNQSLTKEQILAKVAESFSELQHDFIFESERLTFAYEKWGKLQDEKIKEWYAKRGK